MRNFLKIKKINNGLAMFIKTRFQYRIEYKRMDAQYINGAQCC